MKETVTIHVSPALRDELKIAAIKAGVPLAEYVDKKLRKDLPSSPKDGGKTASNKNPQRGAGRR